MCSGPFLLWRTALLRTVDPESGRRVGGSRQFLGLLQPHEVEGRGEEEHFPHAVQQSNTSSLFCVKSERILVSPDRYHHGPPIWRLPFLQASQEGVYSKAAMGKNFLAQRVKLVAAALGLEEPEAYTEQCFRRTTATAANETALWLEAGRNC